MKLLSAIALKLVRVYQKYISPYKGFKCPYGVHVPGAKSCSGYAVKALKEEPFFQAYANIRQRLVCCHEVNKLFTSLHRRRYSAMSKAQAGFVDCDCGGGADCAPDCGSGPDCATPDCSPDCSVPDCHLFSSHPLDGGSCFDWFSSSKPSAGSVAIDVVGDIAGDAVESAVNHAVKDGSAKNNSGKRQKPYVLVHTTDIGKAIYREIATEKLWLVNSEKELGSSEMQSLTAEEAIAWISKKHE